MIRRLLKVLHHGEEPDRAAVWGTFQVPGKNVTVMAKQEWQHVKLELTIFASLQYFVYILLVNKFGVEKCLFIGSILGIQPLLLMPLSLAMHNKACMFLFLALVMGACKVFHPLLFTCISLGINKTVPTSQRATMNDIQFNWRESGTSVAGTLATAAFSSPRFGSMGSLVVFAFV